MDVTIYTTATCPRCKILKAKMDDRGIKYKEVNDELILEAETIDVVPVLEVNGKRMGFREGNDWINKE